MSLKSSRRVGDGWRPPTNVGRCGRGVCGGRRMMLRPLPLVALVVVLVGAGSALAFQQLPPGAQVNDDLAAGINKNFSVGNDDPS
jgi:hypothetical protein